LTVKFFDTSGSEEQPVISGNFLNPVFMTALRYIFYFLFLFIVFLAELSCHHNRLKINEEELINELLHRDNQNIDKVVSAEYIPNVLNSDNYSLPSNGNRLADPENPPRNIDIAGNLKNIRDFRLSDLASDITYIRMEQVPDSTLPTDLKFKYCIMDNYIVAVNLYGIHLYSREGRYIRSVVKNEFTGVRVDPGMIVFRTDYTLKGGGLSVHAVGNDLYYNYRNTMAGQDYIMKVDCSSTELMSAGRTDPEFPDRITGSGTIAFDLNKGKQKLSSQNMPPGLFGGSPDWLLDERGFLLTGPDSYALPPQNENKLLEIRNNSGSLLSSFKRFERLVNYSKSLKRGTDDGDQYEFGNHYFIRPEFNDTVFMVLPPDRLLPAYVINLGEYKVTKQQGVDPDFDLSGKIIPESWAESKDYIFLTFTKDSYDCPANRKAGSVKIYHALYSKRNKELFVIKGDPFDYSAEILENDLDGGVPVWPSSFMISGRDELLVSLKGYELKERVKSEKFRLSKAAPDRKQALERLAESVSGSENILMIIK
jgi:hypothetical protein